MAWKVEGDSATFDGGSFMAGVTHGPAGLTVIVAYNEEAREKTGSTHTDVTIPLEVLDQIRAGHTGGRKP